MKERGCFFQHVTEPKPTLAEVWWFSLKCMQINYLLGLQMICIYLLLHALKVEELHKKVETTDSSCTYIAH